MTLPVESIEEGAHKILFATVPDAEKLCCIVASYDESDKPATSMYTFHSWTIMKCRKLIFTVPELIATPEIGGIYDVYIIISKKFYTLNKLQPLLKTIGLNFQRPTYVVKNTYEACLRYTLTARLAPSWNLVGNYYVQGKDFITTNGPLDSVRVEISVIGDQFQLIMWPSRVVMSPVIFNTFHLSDSAEDPGNQVLDIENYNINVYVIPSMKTAAATFLQTKLHESSPFKSYKDIKRYWKNVYGYRLPDNEDGKLLYVTIKFNTWQPGLTYPIYCLRSTPVIIVKAKNQSQILMNFLTDLTGKIPNICGYDFSSKAYLGIAINQLVHPSTDEGFLS